MSRHRPLRGIKVCAYCGSGYDAFKAMELRGRYCSPECLSNARAARRATSLTDTGAFDVPGAATLTTSA